MTLQLITAKYIGINGSLGYYTGKTYVLVFSWRRKSFFHPECVEIWRARMQHGTSTLGYCPYGSMSAFLNNWDIISDVQLQEVNIQLMPKKENPYAN